MPPKCNNLMIRVLVTLGLVMIPYNACRCQTAQNMFGVTTSVIYAPVADPQQITLNTTSAIPLVLTGYDANGTSLSFAIVDPPSRGELGSVDASTGKVTYSPPAELSGSDSFTFSVTSGVMTSQPATVTILLVPPGGFDLSNSGDITVNPGASTGNTVTITVMPSNGFTGAVNLKCAITSSPSNASSPTTCSIPSLISITGTNPVTVTLTAATSSSTTPGDYAITVTGTDAATGTITASTVVGVTVKATPVLMITLTPANITSAQQLSVQVTASGAADSPTPTGLVTLGGGGYTAQAQALISGITNFLISAGNLAVGTDTLTATYTPDSNSSSIYTNATQTTSVTVSAVPSFALTNSGPVTATAGSSGIATLTITPSGGFTGQVSFACEASGSPMGLTCSAPTATVTGASAATSTLTVTTTATTPVGNHTAMATASDTATGKITASTNISITVNTAPSFTLTASPASVSVIRDSSATSTITVTDVGGFTGSITLTASGLPSGVTATSVAGSVAGTQILTFSASNSATITTTPVTVTITGTSGMLTASTSIALAVTAAPGFMAGSDGTSAITVTQGSKATGTISIVGTNGFAGTVTVTCQVTTAMTTVNDKPSCSMNPGSVNISGVAAQTSTLTVTTTAASSATNQLEKLFWPLSGGTALALVMFLGVPKWRRNWLTMVGILLLVISVPLLGCGGQQTNPGGGGSGDTGTTSGAYTVTVTGTSGAISATVGNVTLTVQ